MTVRHILIATSQRDPQSGQTTQVRDSASAKKIIDSIQTAINTGSNFDTIAVKLSEDPGKNDRNTGAYTGGKYEKCYSREAWFPNSMILFLAILLVQKE